MVSSDGGGRAQLVMREKARRGYSAPDGVVHGTLGIRAECSGRTLEPNAGARG
jgi:hypothetical protein